LRDEYSVTLKNPILEPLAIWVDACANRGEVSRNTVAVGIVVLDHLRSKCPVDTSEVQSKRGEIKGARSGLSSVLEKYDIPASYLKEVTTRAGHQDGQKLFEAFEYGRLLTTIPTDKRDAFLVVAIESLVLKAKEWLARKHLKINCDRQFSPATWISNILAEAKGRSGGKVEQHLVGAKLAERHPNEEIPNNPGHAGDAQTGRAGDFVLASTAYHVTAAPGLPVIDKCKSNLAAGVHPFLLVPRDQVDRARHLAESQGIAERMTIAAIEEFVAQNIIELSGGDQQLFVTVLKAIIQRYNTRLEAVETDLSLKIEID
jgi:Domain of unknown function (DUF4928)